jgi:hypothetical protein
MRFRFGSMFVAMVGLASPVQASMLYAEPGPAARPDSFSFRYGAGSLGTIILDGYRTLDGKNFYHDDAASSKTTAQPFGIFGIFGAVGESTSDSQPTTSFNPFGTPSSNSGNTGSGIGFGGGKESFSLSANGGKGSFGFGGGSPLKGLNPLNLAFTNLTDHGGFQGLGDAGGGVGKVEASATPLPPAWTLMLIGLGGFGWVAQRLQRKSEKVFAV